MSETGGLKFDTNKAPCDLLSSHSLIGTAQVLGYGASKYAPHNWRKGIVYSRIISAVFRHLLAFMRGEDNDPESGLPHIDHVACNVMFLQEFCRTRKDLDDRFISPENKKLNVVTVPLQFNKE